MTDTQLIARNRGSLLLYAERNGIAAACRTFAISKTTFYKIKKLYLQTGSLEPIIRRKPRMPNRTRLSTKKLLLKLVEDKPGIGPCQYARLLREQGVVITSSGIWRCLKRFDLNQRFKRLLYVEDLRASNQPVTERNLKQVRQRRYRMDRGQWPGHIVALDTFYVGHLKKVGRIYQITGIDLFSRFGLAKLYVTKEQTSSANFVEHDLLPCLSRNGVAIDAILTDNGTEFTGRLFRQLLADYDIEHRRIPPGKPMFNGYCERFQRTILEEFYQVIFRKKFFQTLEELQKELNKYLAYYNFERIHSGLSENQPFRPADALKSRSSFLRYRFQKTVTLT